MAIPTHEELQKLKDITRITGHLTQIQTRQLEAWAQVVLAADWYEIECDPDNRTLSVNTSDLDYASMEYGGEEVGNVYRRRMSKFDECVKYLLGTDYSVTIRLKGKLIGQFPPLSPTIKAHPPKE